MLPLLTIPAALAATLWVGAADVSADHLVFVAADRLWIADRRGGVARALPVPPGELSAPVFAPDGDAVAFAARHEGNVEVYVVDLDDPAAAPRRRTFHPGRDLPVAWDAEGLIVRSDGAHPLRRFVQVRLDPERVLREGVALAPAPRPVWTDTDPSWMAWQGYAGGMAPHLWTVAPDGRPVDLGPGDQPAWAGDRLFFLDHATADDGAPEGVLVSSDDEGGDRRVEIRGGVTALASGPDGTLALVRGGEVWLREPSGSTRRVPLRLPLPPPEPVHVPAASALEGHAAHPLDPTRGVAWARGQLVLWGAGAPQVLAGPSRLGPAGLRGDELIAWDGATLRAARLDADGRLRGPLGAPVPGGEGLRGVVALRVGGPDPAGRLPVAVVQWTGEVLVLDGAGGPARVLGRSALGAQAELAFGPGGALAFTIQDARGLRSVWRWRPGEEAARRVTGPRTDDHAPWWGEDGRLYFVGERAPRIDVDARDVATVVGDAALPMVLAREIPAGAVDMEAGLAPAPEATRPAPPAPPALGDLTLTVDLRAEWAAAVREVCAQVRDLRWSEALGGEAFAPGPGGRCADAEADVARLYTRRELQARLRLLVGALGVGHALVMGGTPPNPTGPAVGLLGADLVWTPSGLRIARVLQPDPVHPTRAVLDPDDAGRCVRAIDGIAPRADLPPGALLLGKADVPVVLALGDCEGGPTRTREVVPVSSERVLRWSDWTRRTWDEVDRQSDGRVGWLHLPTLDEEGMAAFERAFHGQREREALIVDLRGNGGGWLSDALALRLGRRAVAAFDWTGGAEQTWPIRSAPPVIVFLVDGATQSEGEVLVAGARAAGLGVVVGGRTWGGLSAGLAGRPLADGGVVHVPAVVWDDPVHGRGLENHGVVPDHPAPPDEALARAVAVALARVATGAPR